VRVAPTWLRRSGGGQEGRAGACGCGSSCARDNWVSPSAAARLRRTRVRHRCSGSAAAARQGRGLRWRHRRRVPARKDRTGSYGSLGGFIGGVRRPDSRASRRGRKGGATVAHRRARGGRAQCCGEVRPQRLEVVPCSAASPTELYRGAGMVEVRGDLAASWRSSSSISPLVRWHSSSFLFFVCMVPDPPCLA